MRAELLIAGNHLRATPDGRVVVRVRGSGPATVTLRSARPIAPRWLSGRRARNVRLGVRRIALERGADTTVTFRLSADDLALLHRMHTMRIAIRLQTAEGARSRRVDLHSPGRSHPHVNRAPRLIATAALATGRACTARADSSACTSGPEPTTSSFIRWLAALPKIR